MPQGGQKDPKGWPNGTQGTPKGAKGSPWVYPWVYPFGKYSKITFLRNGTCHFFQDGVLWRVRRCTTSGLAHGHGYIHGYGSQIHSIKDSLDFQGPKFQISENV